MRHLGMIKIKGNKLKQKKSYIITYNKKTLLLNTLYFTVK